MGHNIEYSVPEGGTREMAIMLWFCSGIGTTPNGLGLFVPRLPARSGDRRINPE